MHIDGQHIQRDRHCGWQIAKAAFKAGQFSRDHQTAHRPQTGSAFTERDSGGRRATALNLQIQLRMTSNEVTAPDHHHIMQRI